MAPWPRSPQLLFRRGNAACSCTQHSLAKPVTAREIHQKKEELYDMISKAEKFTFENSQLIRHLSVHIYPRPGDPKWQRYRIKKWMTNVVNFSGIFTLGVAVGGRALIYLEDRKKAALGVKNKLEGWQRSKDGTYRLTCFPTLYSHKSRTL